MDQAKEKSRLTEEEKSQQRKEIRRRRMLVYFITAAETLLREDGIHDLTIRKVAQEAGYSSATLYSYFKDLDELILFASLKYRREYLKKLSEEITETMTSLEQYRNIYRLFSFYAFREPEIYMNMYFGRHSGNLGEIATTYYELFPEEKAGSRTPIVQCQHEKIDIYENAKCSLTYIMNDGHIQQQNLEMAAQLLVRVHESFLQDVCTDNAIDPEEHTKRFLMIFDHIIATN
ncbi:TetR/AcrR family transcriptional regulator [Christensenellaceae bacterium OttesenSCG-928-M15]|nr:TetR/AcrR family transcriptional regulator [Christensenellaceae bacterium OttesenSCG-928-M15]